MDYKEFTEHECQTLEQIMHLRRDVRGNRFINKPLEDDALKRILHAGLMAPSVGFSQPWRFVTIQEQTTKRAVADIFKAENESAAHLFEDERQQRYQQLKLEGILESAVNIAVFYESRESAVLGQTSMPKTGEYSVVCAIQNMWLMARALNIGLGWVSILNATKVAELLHAQANQSLVAYLCIGHVDTFYDRPELETLGWEQRKNFEDNVYNERIPSYENL